MADNIKFKIKRGLKANLFSETNIPEEGCWYITTDTQEVYVCLDGEIKPIKTEGSFDPEELNQIKSDIAELQEKIDGATGGVVTVATRGELPNVGAADVIYIVTSENATYRYTDTADGNGSHYVAVGRDYSEISTINGGTADSF